MNIRYSYKKIDIAHILREENYEVMLTTSCLLLPLLDHTNSLLTLAIYIIWLEGGKTSLLCLIAIFILLCLGYLKCI